MRRDDTARMRVAHLTRVLGSLGDALAAADIDAVTAAESELEAAVSAFPHPLQAEADDPAALIPELRQAQRMLERCRAIGRASADLITASLAAQGVAPGYQPAGNAPAAPRLGRVRVRA